MTEIKNISYRYVQEGKHNQLEDISLRAERGECLILTGESGCGKTTLTRILNGLCPQFFGGEVQGEYRIMEHNALELSLDELGMLTGSVFQDPRSQFFATNTTDEIVLAMENRNMSQALMREKLNETAHLLQIEDLLNRDIFPLSSGEKQKVAIASVCSVEPPVLILDEPSANLDPQAMVSLGRILKLLKERGYTLIISEHRLYYLRDVFDRLAVMKGGRIAELKSRGEALQMDYAAMVKRGLRLFTVEDIAYKSDQSEDGSAPTIELKNLKFSYGKKLILRDISFRTTAGRVMVINGKNGAGKSTACKVITGIYKENGGELLINGKKCSPRQRIRECFFVQQDADYQLYAASVYEEVTLHLRKQEIDEAQVRNVLEELNLLSFIDRHPGSLSGGQKQRVLIAAAVLSGKDILVFDEPTSGLDGKNMRNMAAIVRKIAQMGKTILIITHDTEFIHLAADDVLCLEDGRVKFKKRVKRMSAEKYKTRYLS